MRLRGTSYFTFAKFTHLNCAWQTTPIQVVMYTTYHDAHRCFEETLSASKLDTLVERCENFRTFPQEEPELLGYEFTEVGCHDKYLDYSTLHWRICARFGVR